MKLIRILFDFQSESVLRLNILKMEPRVSISTFDDNFYAADSFKLQTFEIAKMYSGEEFSIHSSELTETLIYRNGANVTHPRRNMVSLVNIL